MNVSRPQRLAVFSDVHGNLPALEAVLVDIQSQRIDSLINLGDLLSGAVDPAGTVQRLRALGAVTVSGNHERQVLETARRNLSLSDALVLDTISSEDLAWLRTIPRTAIPAPNVLAFHGTPNSDSTYLLQTVTSDGIREATEEEVLDRLGEHASEWEVLLCGHTHLGRIRQLTAGALVVNPGSVGLPAYRDSAPYDHIVETGTPHASYAIVEGSEGKWSAELVLIPYDSDAAAALAEKNCRPDVASALRTGFLQKTSISRPAKPV